MQVRGALAIDSVAQRWLAGADPAAPALLDRDGALTYAELADRVAERSVDLGLDGRKLVVLAGERSREYVVTYLALLTGGHVPVLAGSHAERLAAAWRPAAMAQADTRGWSIRPLGDSPDHELHPDLALLLSTSGSTGSPKLVRLSHANLAANASAIAESLQLTADDRAISALPLHYCYGLSVLHSHLAVGAALVLETASVVDPCFATALVRHGVTNLAAVPHTLDLLEHAGPDRISVPSLRLLTHAGGRLAPASATRWLARTATWGVEFVSMYGQTEATARMAYLPSELARQHPGTLGVPVAGGSLTVAPLATLPEGVPDGTGEIVYRGPNVMMGYAESPSDLGRGAELDELHTGDLGWRDEHGMLRVVGRKARFVKPFGVRVDLDEVERELVATGLAASAAVTGDDGTLVVGAPGADAGRVRGRLAAFTGLPAHRIACVGELPRTETGKIDYPTLLELGRPAGDQVRSGADAGGVGAALANVLDLDGVGPDDTFVALGGDSLSYVEAAVRLEPLLGRLPDDWHIRPVGELQRLADQRPAGSARRKWVSWTDTTAVLRAIGICAVVLTHMRWAYFPGGAHVMLAVVGYNVSRFVLPIERTADRFRLGLQTVARVAVPTVAWVAAGMLLFGAYSVGTLLLVNNYVGPRGHRDDHWHFWFVDVFVHLIVLTLVAHAIPAVRRLDRRAPFALPLAMVAVGVALRQEWAQMDDWYNLRFRTHGVVLFYALGWLVQRARATRHRMLATGVVALSVADTFNLPQREVFIGACLVLLLWCRELPLPRPLAQLVAVLASASMWILITHFSVYPWLMQRLPIGWAYVATLSAGVLTAWLAEHGTRLATRGLASRRQPARRPANLLVPVSPVA